MSYFVFKANEWIKLFLSLKDKQDGYGKENVTPYMHLLVYHVPKFLNDQYGMKIFTGQGVERTNDVVRSIYHKKCNKHDACKDSLLALKRLDVLADYELQPNKYSKQNTDYWTKTIVDDRRKRLRLSKSLTCKFFFMFANVVVKINNLGVNNNWKN